MPRRSEIIYAFVGGRGERTPDVARRWFFDLVGKNKIKTGAEKKTPQRYYMHANALRFEIEIISYFHSGSVRIFSVEYVVGGGAGAGMKKNARINNLFASGGDREFEGASIISDVKEKNVVRV